MKFLKRSLGYVLHIFKFIKELLNEFFLLYNYFGGMNV